MNFGVEAFEEKFAFSVFDGRSYLIVIGLDMTFAASDSFNDYSKLQVRENIEGEPLSNDDLQRVKK